MNEESPITDSGQLSSECPLSADQQRSNLAIYCTNIGLVYLAAPVLYGMVHPAICEHLGTSDQVANLPSTAYLLAVPVPVVVAWYFPDVRSLKFVLTCSYLLTALMGLLVALCLQFGTSSWVIPALVLHAAVMGCTISVIVAFQWEVLARGVSESWRGFALTLAWGFGPLLAAAGSLIQQLTLTGEVGGIKVPRLDYPGNFITLFAASIPIMMLSAFLAQQLVVPQSSEIRRSSFMEGVLGGFGEFISNRNILITILALILVYSGFSVLTNLSLYTKNALGRPLEEFAGYQSATRFSCKSMAGFFLGWLVGRTGPRSGMLLTCGFCACSVCWAMTAPGIWFLLSFGLMGAGELMGTYYPNYIVSCSSHHQIRRNMAFTSLMTLPASAAPYLFGLISDYVGATHGKARGYQASFLFALSLLALAFVLVLWTLPQHPHRKDKPEEAFTGSSAA